MFIASDPTLGREVQADGVPIIGDDIKSQVGATITHRVMAKLFEDRRVEAPPPISSTSARPLLDFMNMLERKRLQSKKISEQAVSSQIPHGWSGPPCTSGRPTTCRS